LSIYRREAAYFEVRSFELREERLRRFNARAYAVDLLKLSRDGEF
jgi:hypothetical protein